MNRRATFLKANWEQYLCGELGKIQPFFKKNNRDNQVAAKDLLRFIYKEVFKWDMQTAFIKTDKNFQEKLKLSWIISTFFKEEKRLLTVSGKIKNEDDIAKILFFLAFSRSTHEFEVNILSFAYKIAQEKKLRLIRSADDIYEANFYLREAIKTFGADNMELYSFFAESKSARRWIKEHSLDKALTCIYSTPLDYFHSAVEEPDELLYIASSLKQKGVAL